MSRKAHLPSGAWDTWPTFVDVPVEVHRRLSVHIQNLYDFGGRQQFGAERRVRCTWPTFVETPRSNAIDFARYIFSANPEDRSTHPLAHQCSVFRVACVRRYTLALTHKCAEGNSASLTLVLTAVCCSTRFSTDEVSVESNRSWEKETETGMLKHRASFERCFACD